MLRQTELNLEALWVARDARYADPGRGRREPLSEREVEAVRLWRQAEAEEIRSAGMAQDALAWRPPPRQS